ncbi:MULTISPECIES: helix-turn-helix transcriptional regulator [Allobacillus]|uniref:Helix-turn-helix domain-containing protein n=1 Tax=Allobacillus salarius TaxID=1955272 RepID=A0A556PDQ5_9BACI|nr:helix-turn-helix transcriptional regulator [Allobacillus salarius]TSJ62494.1 helix-turn-helix domain-containing protein [Allobacillus salarius]
MDLDIAKLIKVEKSKNGFTYEKIATEVGCSSSYVFRLEKGLRKEPSYTVVKRMIEMFGLSEDDLEKYRRKG